MAAKTPKTPKVDIVGQEYDLKVIDQPMFENRPVEGHCDVDNRTLWVKNGQKGKGRRDTDEIILHEVIHAVNIALETGMSEKQVQSLGRGLWAAGVRVVLP